MKNTLSVREMDSILIARAQTGDSRAIDDLMAKYLPTLERRSLQILRDHDLIQDAIQDTRLKVYCAIGRFDPARPLKPWLIRICSNCCYDIRRSRSTQLSSIDDHEYLVSDPNGDVSTKAEQGMLINALSRAIDRLPLRYRTILRLRHFEEMEVLEIAKTLKKPEGTIKSWLFRARALLRAEMAAML